MKRIRGEVPQEEDTNRVMKVIRLLSAEIENEAENSETPFNKKTQELLRKGKVIVPCDDSVKDGVIETYQVIIRRKMKIY